MTHVKICGLGDPENLRVAIEAGARFVGLVFYPDSPRNVSFDTAFELARTVPTGVRTVGLMVDPDDALLERVLTGIQLDMLQLHGGESPERVLEIKSKYHIDVMKVIRVRDETDFETVRDYEQIADWLMFDSKPEKATLPGGTGHSFDWSLLEGRTFSKPWMLAGGLTPEHVADAIKQTNPDAVDVSSGVESAPGIKDPAKIKAFIDAVKNA